MAEMTKLELQTELEEKNSELEAVKAELEALRVAKEAERTTVGASKPDYPEKDPRRPVTIKLFKDGQRYSEALYVNVNDANFVIPRGVPVTVPYFVAKHIEEMNTQDESTAQLVSMFEAQFEENKKFLS